MANLSLPLSKHFTLGELLRSDTAERDEALKQEQENPPDEVIERLEYLAQTALEPLRQRLGFPIRITSGYRCPTVNKLVGGSGTSQHCRGEAADCQLSPRLLTDAGGRAIRDQIAGMVEERVGKPVRVDVNASLYLFASLCLDLEELDVDQVIHEYGENFGKPAWVHISASQRKDKRQVLLVGRYTNKTYLSLAPDEALLRACT